MFEVGPGSTVVKRTGQQSPTTCVSVMSNQNVNLDFSAVLYCILISPYFYVRWPLILDEM